MGSIAKVRGLRAASQPNHIGINDKGAKAVLANRSGRFETKITAISSICPGKAKAKPKLKAVTEKINSNKVTTTIKRPLIPGHPYPIQKAVNIIAKL